MSDLVTPDTLVLAQGAGINVNPQQPPGTEGILTVVNWIGWGAFAVCFVGFIAGAAALAFKHQRGEDMGSMKGLGMALLGTILIGGAGAIVGSIT